MGDSEFDLRALIGFGRRQAKLIVLVMATVLALTLAALFTITPIYSASALVLFDTSGHALIEPDAPSVTAADSARIESEVELLRSDNILLGVVTNEGLVTDPEFGPRPGFYSTILATLRLAQPALPTDAQAINLTLAKLRAAFTVQRRGLTHLIAITVRSADPEKAARLANAVADAYIADQIASKQDSQGAAGKVLAARAELARNDMLAAEIALDQFVSTNLQRIAIDAGRTDLAGLQEQIASLQQAQVEDRNRVDALRSGLESNTFAAVVSQLADQALQQLQIQRSLLTGRIADGEADLATELGRVEESMRVQAALQLDLLQHQLTEAGATEATLKESLRRQVIASDLPNDALADLYELQQRATIARGQYQALLLRLQDITVQASSQLADSRLVSSALAPGSPAFPNVWATLLLASLAGLGLALVLAFLHENLIGGLMNEEQVEAVLKTPVAAVVPREKPRSEDGSLSDLLVTTPLSVFAESIRRMRAMIQQQVTHRFPVGITPVIMVTSTAPKEGKTTLALALARSYALAGQKTLLIDCDLRKPGLHRQLDLQPSHGLVEYLDNQLTVGNLKHITASPNLNNLTVVLGTRRSDLPTDQLLTGERFAGLLQAARTSFDIVVVDTPPVAPVVDGLYIAPHADIIVFVAAWASTAQRDARKALAAITNAVRPGTSILTVLNQQDQARKSYRRKYGAYYDEAY